MQIERELREDGEHTRIDISMAAPKVTKQFTVETVRRGAKVGRNQPCPCGSGRKYKRCCWEKDRVTE